MPQTLTPEEWIKFVTSRRNIVRITRYSVRCRDTDEVYDVDSQALQKWLKWLKGTGPLPESTGESHNQSSGVANN